MMATINGACYCAEKDRYELWFGGRLYSWIDRRALEFAMPSPDGRAELRKRFQWALDFIESKEST